VLQSCGCEAVVVGVVIGCSGAVGFWFGPLTTMMMPSVMPAPATSAATLVVMPGRPSLPP
jgi:hypothetical protein